MLLPFSRALFRDVQEMHRALFTHQKVPQHKKFRFSPFLYHKKRISSLYLGNCLQLSAVDIDKGH